MTSFKTWLQRVGWLIAMWVAGVLVLGTIAWGLRTLMRSVM